MFGNWVNLDDLLDLWRRFRWRPPSAGGVPGEAGEGSGSRRGLLPPLPASGWEDVPAVAERRNLLVSGDRRVDYLEHFSRRYLAGRHSLRALSLACGTGFTELTWARSGRFSRIEACDRAAARIRQAREVARREGLEGLVAYRVADVRGLEMAAGSWDLVLAKQALHHFSPLRPILRRVAAALAEGGYLLANEYVGPSRFQWTERQLEEANRLLELFPERLRRQLGGRPPKRRVRRPSRLGVWFADPSEAVDSAGILPLLREFFEVVELRGYGGTLLFPLLAGIGHHFRSPDPEGDGLLRRCFEAEDRLMESGVLPSDFAVVVCRKRSGAGMAEEGGENPGRQE